MNYYVLVSYGFVLSAIYLVDKVSVLRIENIIGGYGTIVDDFNYQAAIFARKNYTKNFTLICGGAILTQYFILTAAQCLFDNYGNVRQLSYYVGVGMTNMIGTRGVTKIVDKYYRPNVDIAISSLRTNDIALVKLRLKLRLQKMGLHALELPLPYESFRGELAVVSGYGFTWVQVGMDWNTLKLKRINGSSDYSLKYAFVKIREDIDCMKSHPILNIDTETCGQMLSDSSNEKWGICSKDAGNPLVVDNKVIGIAVRNRVDCNDTNDGCIYTKVSSFIDFIYLVLEERLSNYVLTYQNFPYKAAQKT